MSKAKPRKSELEKQKSGIRIGTEQPEYRLADLKALCAWRAEGPKATLDWWYKNVTIYRLSLNTSDV